MAERVTVTVSGVAEVHMTDPTGNYATFCGLDGEDPDIHVQQGDMAPTRDLVSCGQCRRMWEHARTYRPRSLRDDVRDSIMVNFIPSMGGFRVEVDGEPFGAIDATGFFTGPTVVRDFLRVRPADLRTIADRAAVKPVCVQSHGGHHERAAHDWYMEDGSVMTMTTAEAEARRNQ
jgi:hypothetical protein